MFSARQLEFLLQQMFEISVQYRDNLVSVIKSKIEKFKVQMDQLFPSNVPEIESIYHLLTELLELRKQTQKITKTEPHPIKRFAELLYNLEPTKRPERKDVETLFIEIAEADNELGIGLYSLFIEKFNSQTQALFFELSDSLITHLQKKPKIAPRFADSVHGFISRWTLQRNSCLKEELGICPICNQNYYPEGFEFNSRNEQSGRQAEQYRIIHMNQDHPKKLS